MCNTLFSIFVNFGSSCVEKENGGHDGGDGGGSGWRTLWSKDKDLEFLAVLATRSTPLPHPGPQPKDGATTNWYLDIWQTDRSSVTINWNMFLVLATRSTPLPQPGPRDKTATQSWGGDQPIGILDKLIGDLGLGRQRWAGSMEVLKLKPQSLVFGHLCPIKTERLFLQTQYFGVVGLLNQLGVSGGIPNHPFPNE